MSSLSYTSVEASKKPLKIFTFDNLGIILPEKELYKRGDIIEKNQWDCLYQGLSLKTGEQISIKVIKVI